MTENASPVSPNSGFNLPTGLAVAAALLFAAGLAAGLLHAPAALALTLRCAALALLVPFALHRRSLLVWTFLAMLAGAELGVDAPGIASQTHFLGDIFLRLIRMIVAPLIFGGIVTGIAGHNELRGVGRVALKSLIFFEVVTTIWPHPGRRSPSISRRPARASRCRPSLRPPRLPRILKTGNRFC